MESVDSSTGKDDHHVPITVKVAPPSSSVKPPLHDIYASMCNLYLMTLLYLIVLSTIRVFELSPFQTHFALMILSLVTLSVGVASGILIYAQKHLLHSSLVDAHHMMLEVISVFSLLMAVMSIYLVFCLPGKLEWIGYVVVGVIFVLGVVCYRKRFFVHKNPTKSQTPSGGYSTTLMPLPIVLQLFIPVEFKWTRISIIVATVVITVGYNFGVYLRLRKEKRARDLEVDPLIKLLIQEDDIKIVV